MFYGILVSIFYGDTNSTIRRTFMCGTKERRLR